MTIDPTIIERVLSCVGERELVELASDLIRISSFKPDETPVATSYRTSFAKEAIEPSYRRSSRGVSRPLPRCREQAAARA